MVSYIDQLIQRREKISDLELVFELHAALQEAAGQSKPFSNTEIQCARLCHFCVSDGIAELLQQDREAIVEAARFAREKGLTETASILADTLAGVPVLGPVQFSVSSQGKGGHVLDVPQEKWDATDIALSLVSEDFAAAVMDLVAANRAQISIAAPGRVRRRERKDAVAAGYAVNKTAVDLVTELLSHRNPRVLACLEEDMQARGSKGTRVVPVEHLVNAPAERQGLQQLRKRYGAVTEPLLAIYERHDGLELFKSAEGPAFVFAPIGEWDELLREAVDWATTVTWQDAPHDVPRYLASAIAFGYIPGDSERWLLITEGKHSGKIMLSDTDLVSDRVRMQSMSEFLAVLIKDTPRIIGSGGYIRYDQVYYPKSYEFD